MCGPAVKPIALVDGGGDRPRSRDARPADLGDRRHHHLARRGRIHRARRRQRAGLHRGDDLRLQDRPGDDLRPRRPTWTAKGYRDDRGFPRPRGPARSPTGSISISTTSPRPRSTRISASSAAAATSSARTPRTRRSFASVDGKRQFVVNDAECVGCNLCVLVCPVEGCITLVHQDRGRRSAHRPRLCAAAGELDDASQQPERREGGGVAPRRIGDDFKALRHSCSRRSIELRGAPRERRVHQCRLCEKQSDDFLLLRLTTPTPRASRASAKFRYSSSMVAN